MENQLEKKHACSNCDVDWICKCSGMFGKKWSTKKVLVLLWVRVPVFPWEFRHLWQKLKEKGLVSAGGINIMSEDWIKPYENDKSHQKKGSEKFAQPFLICQTTFRATIFTRKKSSYFFFIGLYTYVRENPLQHWVTASTWHNINFQNIPWPWL